MSNRDGYKTRGKRRYSCDECGAMTFFTKREEDRAARLRCNGCGSARLMVSQAGAKRLVEANDAKRQLTDAAEGGAA